MKKLIVIVLLLCGCATVQGRLENTATDVTWSDKATGSPFTAADANSIKTAVNSKLDKTSPAGSITDAGSGVVISAAERAKLAGVEEGAQANPPVATFQEVLDGTEAATRLISPALLKAGAQAHGGSSFVYIAWASDTNGTDFTTTYDQALTHIAILKSATEIETPQASDFTGLWKRYVGTDGLGLDECTAANNDCGISAPRNASTPAWTPGSGYWGMAQASDGTLYCNLGMGGGWVLCSAALGTMSYPGIGVPFSSGGAWGTSLALSTTIANPGSDSALPTEQAVRELFATASGGYVATPTYSDAACVVGNWSFDGSYVYICEGVNQWDRYAVTFAGWNNPTPTNPTLSSATIASSGTSITLLFDQAVTQGAGYNNGDWNVDCTTAGNDIAVTYSSGNTTNSHVYTLASTVYSGDTCNIDFNGDANSEENAGGYDLAAIVSAAVTNNSTASQSVVTLGHDPAATPSGTGSSPGSFARYTATASFTGRSIRVYTAGSGGTGLIGGVYTDSTGVPGTLIDDTATGATVATGWACMNTSSNISITSGNSYWIGWLAATSIIYGRTTGTNDRYGNSDTYPTLSATYNGTATTDYNLGVYLSSEVCP